MKKLLLILTFILLSFNAHGMKISEMYKLCKPYQNHGFETYNLSKLKKSYPSNWCLAKTVEKEKIIIDRNKLKIFIKIFYQISIHKNNKKLFTTKDNSPRSGGGLPIDRSPWNTDQGLLMDW